MSHWLVWCSMSYSYSLCSDCSSDSICVGVIHNRSICICPPHKGGPRCLLKLTCPIDQCWNNAECVVLDDGRTDDPLSLYRVLKNISENIVNTSPNIYLRYPSMISKSHHPAGLYCSCFVVADILWIEEQYQSNVMPQKLTMFQRSVTLYFESSLHSSFYQGWKPHTIWLFFNTRSK